MTALTGAGVSASSGVPTFRDPDGLWKTFRPAELATPEAFRDNPGRVWEWYLWRRGKIAACTPNRAHRVLARWRERFGRFELVTQNVDGLHERAGSTDVIRFHGSVWEVRCAARCADSPEGWPDEMLQYAELPPPCPYCGGPLRPGVVWFGEVIPADTLRRSSEAADCEVFIVAGTSALVYPAIGLVAAARSMGAFTIEINVERTPVSGDVDLSISGPAEEILGLVDDQL